MLWPVLEDSCQLFWKPSGTCPDLHDLSKKMQGEPCYKIGLLPPQPWMIPVCSQGLLKAEFAKVTSDLIPTYCWLFSSWVLSPVTKAWQKSQPKKSLSSSALPAPTLRKLSSRPTLSFSILLRLMNQYQLILLPLSCPVSLKAMGPLALASSLHPGTRFLHSVGSFPCFHLLPAAYFLWSSVSSHKQPPETVASLHGYLGRSFLGLEEAVL